MTVLELFILISKSEFALLSAFVLTQKLAKSQGCAGYVAFVCKAFISTYGSRSASSIRLVRRNCTFLLHALLLTASVSSEAVQPPHCPWACVLYTECTTVESNVQTVPKHENGLGLCRQPLAVGMP